MERTSKDLEKAKSQGGGARTSTPRRSPGPTRLRLHLGFQNLTSPKLTPSPHTELDLDVLYMVGTRISTGIMEISGRPESVRVLHHHLWAAGSCIMLEPVRVASKGLACP
jgi:hypothetical protein